MNESLKDLCRTLVLTAMDVRDHKNLPDDKFSEAEEIRELAIELEESIVEDEPR